MSLVIKNLFASLGDRIILKGINLEIKPGTIHAIMGPNGGGKSTLAQVIMGNPNYEIQPFSKPQGKNPKILINKENIINLKTDERARKGLFLAFQNPMGIPGVTVANLLRTAYSVKNKNSHGSSSHNPALSVWAFNEMLLKEAKKLKIPQDFLRRSLNEAFSGGEKKKIEMLQAVVMSPQYAIFDEIDTGLDVDALNIVARGIQSLKKKGIGIILITHYQRILKFALPDFVHILVKGEIVESGGKDLARDVEKNGYKKWME